MHPLPKLILFVFGTLLLLSQSCKQPGSTTTVKIETASLVKTAKQTKQIADNTDEPIEEDSYDDYTDYYVLIVDTGKQYPHLQEAMQQISATTGIKIDTMNRSYRADKNLIALLLFGFCKSEVLS